MHSDRHDGNVKSYVQNGEDHQQATVLGVTFGSIKTDRSAGVINVFESSRVARNNTRDLERDPKGDPK
jgi:hypothetical protein